MLATSSRVWQNSSSTLKLVGREGKPSVEDDLGGGHISLLLRSASLGAKVSNFLRGTTPRVKILWFLRY
ncbi:MAG: hypothetical protein Kow009_06790 [Spirochaetales bacterium]